VDSAGYPILFQFALDAYLLSAFDKNLPLLIGIKTGITMTTQDMTGNPMKSFQLRRRRPFGQRDTQHPTEFIAPPGGDGGYHLIGFKTVNDKPIDEAERIRRWEHAAKFGFEPSGNLRLNAPERLSIWARFKRSLATFRS
jgi:hypothetical protein